MKKIFIISTFLVVLFSMQTCNLSGQQKEINKKLLARKDSIPQYPKEQQVNYVLHLNTDTPYELYLDDILINYEFSSGISQTIQLNPYLLQNGNHLLKIRYLPKEDSKDGMLHPQDVYYNKDAKWDIYFIELKLNPNEPLGYEGNIDYPQSSLEVIPPPTAVPFWEQEFKLEIKNLPYDLKGWRDGEDLTEWDLDELETEVVAFYNKLRTLLHEGKIAEFMELTSRQDLEVATAMYDTPEKYEAMYKENFEDLTNECVGHLLPIDNCEMKLYANGKLVALEIPNGEHKNWGALINDSETSSYTWGIYIYKPKGSKDFVAIRK